jgi:hypothetical protein
MPGAPSMSAPNLTNYSGGNIMDYIIIGFELVIGAALAIIVISLIGRIYVWCVENFGWLVLAAIIIALIYSANH